jgi:hypothetical protein
MSNGSHIPADMVEMHHIYNVDIYNVVIQDASTVDIEQKEVHDAHLVNDTVQNFAWRGITVAVKDHKTKKRKAILENVEGFVEAGMLLISQNTQGISVDIADQQTRRDLRIDGT